MSDPEPPASRVGLKTWLRLRRVTLVACAVTFLAVFSLSTVTAVQVSGVSVYDETAHFDYVAQMVRSHRVPPVGTGYGELIAVELSCRGMIAGGGIPPDTSACDAPLTPAQLAPGGINPALTYSPLYYLAVSAGAVTLKAVTGLTLFTAARITMALVYAAGAALLAWALIRLRVPAVTAAALSVLVCSLPGPLWQGSTINSDGFAYLFGAAALLIATTSWSRRRRLVLMTLVGLLAVQVKLSFLPVMGVALLLVAVWPHVNTSWQRSQWRLGEIARTLGGVLAGFVVIAAVSQAVSMWRSSTLVPGSTPDGGMSASLAAGKDLYGEVLTGLGYVSSSVNFFNIGTSLTLGLLAGFVGISLCGAPLVLAMINRPLSDSRRVMALVATLALFGTAAALPAAFKIVYGAAGVQPRYLLPAVPLLVAAIGMSLSRTRLMSVGLAAVALWVWALSLTQAMAY